jgi:hypothetical protein
MTKSQTPNPKSQLNSSLTFIPSEDQGVDLRARGFTTELAAELRQRLLTFEEDWNAPGMAAYDKSTRWRSSRTCSAPAGCETSFATPEENAWSIKL